MNRKPYMTIVLSKIGADGITPVPAYVTGRFLFQYPSNSRNALHFKEYWEKHRAKA